MNLDQVVEESKFPASTEVPKAQAQVLAEEDEQTKPTDDGDASGLVVAATLVVCLSSAAGIYSMYKRSPRRKS